MHRPGAGSDRHVTPGGQPTHPGPPAHHGSPTHPGAPWQPGSGNTGGYGGAVDPYHAVPYGALRDEPGGALAWGLGLLVLLPIGVSPLVAAIAMVAAGRAQPRHAPVAAANGRNAANWGLTFLIASIVLAVLTVVVLVNLRDSPQEVLTLVPIASWLLLTVAHLVFCVIGMIQANRLRVFWAPALPVLRR